MALDRRAKLELELGTLLEHCGVDVTCVSVVNHQRVLTPWQGTFVTRGIVTFANVAMGVQANMHGYTLLNTIVCHRNFESQNNVLYASIISAVDCGDDVTTVARRVRFAVHMHLRCLNFHQSDEMDASILI